MNRIIFSFLFLFIASGCAESPGGYADPEDLRCEEHAGTCTNEPSIICGAGLEPLTDDDPRNTNCLGQCCIEAARSNTCNPSPSDSDESEISIYNCLPSDTDDECPGNWSKPGGNLTCEEGRVCCFWSL